MVGQATLAVHVTVPVDYPVDPSVLALAWTVPPPGVDSARAHDIAQVCGEAVIRAMTHCV